MIRAREEYNEVHVCAKDGEKGSFFWKLNRLWWWGMVSKHIITKKFLKSESLKQNGANMIMRPDSV